MSLKISLGAIATFIGIVALMMAAPLAGASDGARPDALAAAHRAISSDQSPGIVVAEDEPAGASADSDSNSDSESKDSDDETADDQNDSNDQADQQSAGNQQVAPQVQTGDNDAGDADEAGQAPQNAYPQQVNPNQ